MDKEIEILQDWVTRDREMRNNSIESDYDKFCEEKCKAIESLIFKFADLETKLARYEKEDKWEHIIRVEDFCNKHAARIWRVMKIKYDFDHDTYCTLDLNKTGEYREYGCLTTAINYAKNLYHKYKKLDDFGEYMEIIISPRCIIENEENDQLKQQLAEERKKVVQEIRDNALLKQMNIGNDYDHEMGSNDDWVICMEDLTEILDQIEKGGNNGNQ